MTKSFNKFREEVLQDWDDSCVREMINDIIDRTRKFTIAEMKRKTKIVKDDSWKHTRDMCS